MAEQGQTGSMRRQRLNLRGGSVSAPWRQQIDRPKRGGRRAKPTGQIGCVHPTFVVRNERTKHAREISRGSFHNQRRIRAQAQTRVARLHRNVILTELQHRQIFGQERRAFGHQRGRQGRFSSARRSGHQNSSSVHDDCRSVEHGNFPQVKRCCQSGANQYGSYVIGHFRHSAPDFEPGTALIEGEFQHLIRTSVIAQLPTLLQPLPVDGHARRPQGNLPGESAAVAHGQIDLSGFRNTRNRQRKIAAHAQSINNMGHLGRQNLTRFRIDHHRAGISDYATKKLRRISLVGQAASVEFRFG